MEGRGGGSDIALVPTNAGQSTFRHWQGPKFGYWFSVSWRNGPLQKQNPLNEKFLLSYGVSRFLTIKRQLSIGKFSLCW